MATRTQCEYCGDDLGGFVDKRYGEPVTCGKRECERWAYEDTRIDREDAHERLDRMRGWD
jgi:hypothetical protein